MMQKKEIIKHKKAVADMRTRAGHADSRLASARARAGDATTYSCMASGRGDADGRAAGHRSNRLDGVNWHLQRLVLAHAGMWISTQ